MKSVVIAMNFRLDYVSWISRFNKAIIRHLIKFSIFSEVEMVAGLPNIVVEIPADLQISCRNTMPIKDANMNS